MRHAFPPLYMPQTLFPLRMFQRQTADTIAARKTGLPRRNDTRPAHSSRPWKGWANATAGVMHERLARRARIRRHGQAAALAALLKLFVRISAVPRRSP